MIVTVTPNPSVDRTVELAGPLARGEVQRSAGQDAHPGGKGVNITRALTDSGEQSLAIFPAAAADPFVELLAHSGTPYATVPVQDAVRSNVTLSEPDGTTTKINAPGPRLSAQERDELLAKITRVLRENPAEWLVLAGSLPQGLPDSFYADVIEQLRTEFGAAAPKIAVDASGAPQHYAIRSAPTLIKPNAQELAELAHALGYCQGERDGAGGNEGECDGDADQRSPACLEARLEAEPQLAARLAERVRREHGIGAVLVSLGANGAVLVNADGAWHATHPRVEPKSTVGAGDSALAGYLYALTHADAANATVAKPDAGSKAGSPSDVTGAGSDTEARCETEMGSMAQRALRRAVAAGTQACQLPGTQMPRLDLVDPRAVTIHPLAGINPSH